MKIYYIANARIPTERAHGIQLAKMCEALLNAGADLELVLPRRKTDTQSIKEFYGLKCDIPFRKIWSLDFYHIGSAGYYISSLSFMVSYALFFIFKKIKGEKFVIYTIDMDQFSFAFIPFLGVKYFVEIHDAKKDSILYKTLFNGARGIITINSIIKKKLAKNFSLNSEKIIVFPNGIDLDFFAVNISKTEARKKLGLPENKKIALYGGQFYKWKGFEIFPETVKKLNNDALFTVVGAEETEVKNGIAVSEFSENLKFLGKHLYQEMPLWYAAADALIVLGTKKNDYSYLHTSPMKLFEYMAAQRPIIAANTPAIREVVSNEEVFFYEPDNAEDMARAINFVFNNQEEARKKSERAFKKVMRSTWHRRGSDVFQFITS